MKKREHSALKESALVVSLRSTIAALEKDKEYFKGRCERLELMLIPNRRPVAATPNGAPSQFAPRRKSWPEMLQKWNAKEFAEQPKKEEKKPVRAAN